MRLAASAVLFALALPLAACRAPRPAAAPTAGGVIEPDLGRIGDGRAWTLVNGEASATLVDGRAVARLAPIGGNRKGSNVAFALVDGVDFAQGSFEVALEGPGGERPSFLGVAFAVVDQRSYEAVYFRPFNFRADDALHRGHAVQYIAWPEHTWEKLRAQSPGVFEASIAPAPDPAAWFRARVEVGARDVRVFVDGAAEPCLTAPRLGGATHGRIGLWVDSQPGAFAELAIRPRGAGQAP